MPITEYPIWVWTIFFAVVLAALFVDVAIVNRRSHSPTARETFIWSGVWIGLALAFDAFILVNFGLFKAKEFLTGYMIEMSLSIDNLFVFLLIFGYFAVPKRYQHRVLFWGIFMAMAMRMAMIFAGSELVERFEWILYLFGVFLVYTGIKMFGREKSFNPERSLIVRFTSGILPVSQEFDEDNFFTRINGRITGTALLLVLIVINVADLIFAIDSIPAIFGVTTDRFIVYTSNIFAILGLRTFFFLLADIAGRFHYLKYALAFVLTFIGFKMLLPLAGGGLIMIAGEQNNSAFIGFVRRFVEHDFDRAVIDLSLAIVAAAIIISIILSAIFRRKATDLPRDNP